jgi:low affinity Fe/Cu permease
MSRRHRNLVLAFAAAPFFVIIWAISGPLFHYSDTWQLVINTVSSIVTFLMVFLIQNTQDRNTAALEIKIDELIRVTSDARRDVVGIEDLSLDDLDAMKHRRRAMAPTVVRQRRRSTCDTASRRFARFRLPAPGTPIRVLAPRTCRTHAVSQLPDRER